MLVGPLKIFYYCTVYEKFDKKWHEKSKLEIVKTRNKSEEQIVSKDLVKSIISFWSSQGYSQCFVFKIAMKLDGIKWLMARKVKKLSTSSKLPGTIKKFDGIRL